MPLTTTECSKNDATVNSVIFPSYLIDYIRRIWDGIETDIGPDLFLFGLSIYDGFGTECNLFCYSVPFPSQLVIYYLFILNLITYLGLMRRNWDGM